MLKIFSCQRKSDTLELGEIHFDKIAVENYFQKFSEWKLLIKAPSNVNDSSEDSAFCLLLSFEPNRIFSFWITELCLQQFHFEIREKKIQHLADEFQSADSESITEIAHEIQSECRKSKSTA